MLIYNFDIKNNNAIIKTDGLDNLNILRSHFSVENEGVKIAVYRRSKKIISARKYAITATGKFKIGLYPNIYNYLISLQIPFKVNLSPKFKASLFPKYNIKKINNLNLIPYPYQTKALKKCLNFGRGVIEVGTGGGKTYIMAVLINTLQNNINPHKTLVVVPGVQLAEQTFEAFEEYGLKDICLISGKHKYNPTANIYITNTQIITNKKQDLSYLKQIDLVLIDECHILKRENKICDIIENIKTPHKFGFTGTLPENLIDKWNIIGILGPQIYKQTSKQLRDDKFLSNAQIIILRLQHKNFPEYHLIEDLSKDEKNKLNPTAKYELENDFIYNDSWRNKIIRNLCNKIDQNTLIIVDRIQHGEELQRVIQKTTTNKRIYFIQGSVDVDDREKIKKLMEEKDNVICIAMAKIFSTGINIKNLPYIIFALAGKAKTKIIQSIGRGLRKHENKQKLVIFDLVDNYYYAQTHLIKRKKLYENEQLNFTERSIYE